MQGQAGAIHKKEQCHNSENSLADDFSGAGCKHPSSLIYFNQCFMDFQEHSLRVYFLPEAKKKAKPRSSLQRFGAENLRR